MLSLERQRGPLRVVLVVGARLARGLGDAGQFPVQRCRPILGSGPLR